MTPFQNIQAQQQQQPQNSPAQQPGASMQGGMPQAQPSTQGVPQEAQYPGGAPYGDDQDTTQSDMVSFALSEVNLAKHIRDHKKDGQKLLDEMATKIIEGYEIDEASRKDWMDKAKEYMNMALLVRENKTWPWPKAANVKYPLIATAAMQFSARAYPALVPSDGSIVKARVSAVDLQGNLEQAAIRVSKHM